MRCAVVDAKTRLVTNIIVADAERDSPPWGTILVQLEPDSLVDYRWSYDDELGFKPRDPELIEAMRVRDEEILATQQDLFAAG